jgi:hypothetical protein
VVRHAVPGHAVRLSGARQSQAHSALPAAWLPPLPGPARLLPFALFNRPAILRPSELDPQVLTIARTRDLFLNRSPLVSLPRSLRYQGERGFALMSQRWRALQHVMVSLGAIGDIAKAALVLLQFEHKMIS